MNIVNTIADVFLFLLLFSCANEKSVDSKYASSLDSSHSNCKFLEDADVVLDGYILVDSKGNIYFYSKDILDGHKLNLILPHMKESVYANFDTYLNMKPPNGCGLKVEIYGHYLRKVDSTLVYGTTDFFVHQISFLVSELKSSRPCKIAPIGVV